MVSPRATTVPLPYIVSPTNKFDGDDGLWSTFGLEIGTPSQSFRVLPATGVSEIWVPNAATACTGPLINYTLCGSTRGVDEFQNLPSSGFQTTNSTTWNGIDIGDFSSETNLFTNEQAQYGTDTVAVGKASGSEPVYGPQISGQIIAAYTNSDFYVGELGLSTAVDSFQNYPGSFPSLLDSMKNQSLIGSLSYGYTAGQAYGRSKSVPSLRFVATS